MVTMKSQINKKINLLSFDNQYAQQKGAECMGALARSSLQICNILISSKS